MRTLKPLLLAASLIALSATEAAAHAAPRALSPWDAQIYAAAFAAAAAGDFAAADAQARRASDRSLDGWLQQRKLLSPEHKATYAELSAWLVRHADLPGADRVHALALARKPAGAPAPAAPATAVGVRSWADLAGRPRPARSDGAGRSARELFYAGETAAAYQAALATGEGWIAGLAAFRLGRFEEAAGRFDKIARDGSESPWLRAAGGYWAARAATAGGSPELAPGYLRLAAAHPTTFYGLIAERQLGLEPEFAPVRGAPELIRASHTGDGADTAALLRDDARARRAAALAQVGLVEEAGQEIRAGLAAVRTEDARRAWMALAAGVGAQLSTGGGRFDPRDYPTPELRPQGGFTLDRALVYAVVRQESRFNPRAGSPVGAAGLMQLMPATAAEVAGDPRLRHDTSPLRDDPAFNLRLGKSYLASLLRQPGVNGDLLRALAAYNGGRGAVLKAHARTGDGGGDALMMVESLPYAETRNYVERVMAGYWIYRRMWGLDSPTLDAVAAGARTVDPRLDAAPPPGAQRFAVVDVR